MASLFATPESFKDSAAESAAASVLKIAKTTVLFDMNIPFLAQARRNSRAGQQVRGPNVHPPEPTMRLNLAPGIPPAG
jgi:hypothetical protein